MLLLIDVLNVDVTARERSEKREFVKSIKSRLTVSQVVISCLLALL